jgi:hypothetical protein
MSMLLTQYILFLCASCTAFCRYRLHGLLVMQPSQRAKSEYNQQTMQTDGHERRQSS